MKFTQAIAILAVSALTISAFAQGGGGRGQGRQGGGRMMGMMGMMGGGGGVMPATFLLQRDDVQTDLKLTSEQKDKLDALRTKSMEKLREAFTAGGGAANGGGGGRGFQLSDEQRKTLEKMNEETTKEVNTILTAEQNKRIRQIGIQLAGPRAATNPEIAKELGVSEAQTKRIADLMTKQREANQAIMEKVRSQELDREEAQAKREGNNKVLDAEIEKILTEAQRMKLKEMAGPEFKRDDS